MVNWYGKTIEKIVRSLNSDISLGLNENKVIQMRETYGQNIILKPKSEKLLTFIMKEIKQLWILHSLIFVVMLHYNGLSILAHVVTLITVSCFTLLTNGHYKEEKDLMAIDNLNAPFSNVIRNGKTCKIGCEEIVVGDIVILEKHSYVPADIRIIECEDLKVREVAVTGEKYEVEKYPTKIEGEISKLSEIRNIVFKSSVVTEGSAIGIVIATGMNTQIGKVIKVLLEHKDENSFFGKAITKTLNKVSLIAIGVSLIALVFAILIKSDIHEIGNTLIYILMSFNFSLFIIIISLFFSIVFGKFKKKDIYIKNISTILLLSNISAIFLKKIGAISESKLVFREVYCDGTLLDIQSQSIKLEDTMERIISIALLCNDARLSKEGELCIEDTNSIENLAEGAILKFCSERFVEISELESKHRRLFKISYDSHKRIKTVVNEVEGRYRANVAGVLDSLLNKCTHILVNGVEKEIKDTDIQDIINTHIAMSNKDYSVVAFGYRNFNYEPSVHENIESNLVFVGLMGFENPIKESSYEAMKTCRNNNIRLIVDEVDNKLASFAFGKRMGIIKKKEAILSGIEMDHMSKEEFEKNIEGISIFSKISPKHKSEIVNALNSKGYSIASVGDTLIDLEYLSNSHISISVGTECSNIVKKLSSLFLKENDFGEIINLIVDSKRIVNCIGRLLLFVSVMAFNESFITLISLAMTGEMPYTLSAVLYLNFIVIPICGFSILLQNRNTNQSISKIDFMYISKASMKNSVMVSAAYFLMLAFISKFEIPSFESINFMVLTIYGSIFSLKLLYKKHYSENKLSYNLIIFNLLLQIPTIIYLVR